MTSDHDRARARRGVRATARRPGPTLAAAIALTLGLASLPGWAAEPGPAPASGPLPGPLPAPAAMTADQLRPFVATYAVEWKGITAGTTTLELTPAGADRYVYRSRIAARGLFRLIFPEDISQSSRLTIEDGTVRPLEYRADDGPNDAARAIALDFDWAANRVRGTAEKKRVDVELRPGTQDPMSIQLVMMRTLAADRLPKTFLMIEKTEISGYDYTHEGSARLHTTLGDLDTVIWSSRRPDSDRVTRMWYAPELGFMPVRAERTRGGRTELEMRIRTLRRP